MSRSRYTFLILCFGIAVFCFLGLTQSAPITLEVTASWYPWVAPDDVPMYDDWDDAIAVESLGKIPYVSWAAVLDYAARNIQAGYEINKFSYSLDDLRDIMENNIFTISQVGICKVLKPSSYYINLDKGDSGFSYDLLNAYAARLILLDKNMEPKIKQILTTLTKEVTNPPTVEKWNSQRLEWLGWEDYYDDDKSEYGLDYQKVKTAKYKDAILGALDFYIKEIDATDYNAKALYTGNGWWSIMRQDGNKLYWTNDTSAFKFRSLCYRMGKDAAMKLKEHIQFIKLNIKFS
ncbi:MAG TPA: hypothetical protein PL188_08355 [Candidatus Cloacimonadota bacterium]|nr:hypothetical protein [Candidatus Cloacimonadota bacterium]